ncbi:MAG TPA: hypothetical protein VNE16_02745 [Vicinamibacterales bacterium]|nr:hypothetical protein [Vicinamibacterales bacterium]
MGRLLHVNTPVEFFKEAVEAALLHQRLQAGALTSSYLVQLLAGFVQLDSATGESADDQPLGVRFLRALEAGGARQRTEFRQVADEALFLSGFFGDSLASRLIPIDYYVSLGATSYAWLSQHERDTVAAVFADLAGRFVAFVDVLSEVSERSALTTNADLLRLYEKWLRTGSVRNEQLLVEHGIVLGHSSDGRHVH